MADDGKKTDIKAVIYFAAAFVVLVLLLIAAYFFPALSLIGWE